MPEKGSVPHYADDGAGPTLWKCHSDFTRLSSGGGQGRISTRCWRKDATTAAVIPEQTAG